PTPPAPRSPNRSLPTKADTVLHKKPRLSGVFYGLRGRQVKNPTQPYTFALHPSIFHTVHINITFISLLATGRYTRPHEQIR
ncbi:hypothetical protein, partial [Pseudomonas sp. UBA6554]|uniref:hypothetical protein n=1 Tax=Pseudomonas sp. UBA6554 TaxID=1947331 RepID=UPI002580D4B5